MALLTALLHDFKRYVKEGLSTGKYTKSDLLAKLVIINNFSEIDGDEYNAIVDLINNSGLL